ncbi:MAG: hypothetical protein ACKVW3_11265 [Phycisphaerales bacterium]
MPESVKDTPGTLIRDRLVAVRRRARAALVGTAVASIVAIVLAAIVLASGADFILRGPGWWRGLLLVAGVVALAWFVRRNVVPAWRFAPPLTEVALRVERAQTNLRGVLASGLELSEAVAAPSRAAGEETVTRAMAGRVAEEARARFAAVGARALVDSRRLRHSLLTLTACLVATSALALMVGPRLSGIALARVLTPWADASWPKRTEVVDTTAVEVHPIGSALVLRAAVTRTDRPLSATRVTAKYRLWTAGAAGAIERAPLTGQGRTIGLSPEEDRAASGELYERLIEPGVARAAGAPTREATAGVAGELEYWFETEDDATPSRRIMLVYPPRVEGARATITPPEYVATSMGSAGSSASGPGFAAGRKELGPGNDARAIVGPILAGSEIRLEIGLNKPVAGPDAANEAEAAAWVERALAGLEAGAKVDAAGGGWVVTWRAEQGGRVVVRPTDEYGLRPDDESAYTFEVVEDRGPTATVVEPREDEPVLATAKVELAGEGRDDAGVEALWMTRQIAKPAPGSIGAAAEPTGEGEWFAGTRLGDPGLGDATVGSDAGGAGAVEALGQTTATVRTTLDLATMAVKPGDEVWITAIAADGFVREGERHEPARSSPRKLRIIREEELVAQIRDELAGVRKIAMRLDEEQAALRQAVANGAVTADERQKQAGLSPRIRQQRTQVERLSERIERNGLRDETMRGLLDDAATMLDQATRASERASSAMDAAASDKPGEEPTPLDESRQREVGGDQETVREELGRLVEMLDRGEDSWLVSRELQRLAEQQRELLQRTQKQAERTMGKKAEDLTPTERGEIERLSEEQSRLARGAEKVMDALSQRSKQLKSSDAAQAAAMEKAEQVGREQQVAESMDKASADLKENQTSTAEQEQEQALEALEKMQEEMAGAQKNRDKALRRVLASLMETLGRLVREQEAAVAALGAAIKGGAWDGLDAGMLAIAKGTLGAAEEAKGDRTMAAVASVLRRAGTAQAEAIAAIRATDGAGADKGERESLRLLRLALEEAKKLEEDAKERDQDRRRQELRKVYREALELQGVVLAETEPMTTRALDRRDRPKARALGERQEVIRGMLEKAREETEELAEAGVFEFAHERLDRATGTAAKRLKLGQADGTVKRQQETAMTILASLIQALDEQAEDEDEFQEDSGGGEAGGGGGQGGQQPPLIPPLAELRLLRALQQEAADLTHRLDGPEATPEELKAVGEYQRSLAKRAEELGKKVQPPKRQEPGR